jgi:hypothetical protein
LRQFPRHSQARAIREDDVEQHHVGTKTPRLVQRAAGVGRLTDDQEPCANEHPARESPKARMIVDDQDAHRRQIVAPSCSGTPLNPVRLQGFP